MRRHPDRPPTPEENRARNTARILNPPPPTLADRYHQARLAVEEWWGRHVSHRNLHRHLDALRLDVPVPRPGRLLPDDPYDYGPWPSRER